MTPIPIPAEVLEAAARAYELEVRRLGRDPLRAAAQALLSAWPGMFVAPEWNGMQKHPQCVYLPMPQEASDVAV